MSPALDAVRAGRLALLDRGGLAAEQVRQRVSARFPQAASLPARPELDGILDEAASGLRWVAEAARYVLDDAGSLVSSSTTWTGGTRYDTSEEADADDHGHLTFRSGTVALTPEPAQDVRPGDGWEGLLAGTRYRLKAGCDDVEYETSTGATVRLSQDIGSQQARDVARRLGGVKKGGGRLYVNEAGVVIGPVRRDLTWIDVYVGRVGPTPGSGRP